MFFRAASLAALLSLACVNVAVAGPNDQLPAGTAGAVRIHSLRSNTYLVSGANAAISAPGAHYDTKLTDGDWLLTDGDGRVSLRLTDGSEVSAGTNSELRVVNAGGDNRSTIQLERGRLRVRSTHAIEVQTSTAHINADGDDFAVDATIPGRITIICLEGTVQVRSTGTSDEVSECEAGDSVTVIAGKSPRPARPMNFTELATWRNITDPDQAPAFEPFP